MPAKGPTRLLITNDGSSTNGVASILNPATGLVDFTPDLFNQFGDSARSIENVFTMVRQAGGNSTKIFRWDGGSGPLTIVGTFATVGTVGISGIHFSAVNENFWALSGISGFNFNTPSWRKFDKTGALLAGPIGPITFVPNQTQAIAVSWDETIGYHYGGIGNNQPIKRWDLVGNVAMADLVADLGDADTSLFNLYNVVNSTDIIAVLMKWTGGADGGTRIIRRYTAAGAIVFSVTFATVLGVDSDIDLECCEDPLRDSIWARWPGPPFYNMNNGSRFSRLSLLDGSTISFSDNVPDANNNPTPTCAMVAVEDPCVCPPPPPPGSAGAPIIPIGLGTLSSIVGSGTIPIGGVGMIGDELDMIFGEERFNVIAHQTITASGVAQSFTATDEQVGMAIVTTEGDPVRWLIGQNPTATDGNLAPGGTTFMIANISNIRNFRCILAAGSAAAKVTANFARA